MKDIYRFGCFFYQLTVTDEVGTDDVIRATIEIFRRVLDNSCSVTTSLNSKMCNSVTSGTINILLWQCRLRT